MKWADFRMLFALGFAYENGKINFSHLQNAYQQLYSVQIIYLQFENQYLAQRVALEQTVGSPPPN